MASVIENNCQQSWRRSAWGLTLWEGEFEGVKREWLRWTDKNGNLLLTGEERAEQERLEKEEALQKATEALQRAEKLAAMLRELGKDPDEIQPRDKK